MQINELAYIVDRKHRNEIFGLFKMKDEGKL